MNDRSKSIFFEAKQIKSLESRVETLEAKVKNLYIAFQDSNIISKQKKNERLGFGCLLFFAFLISVTFFMLGIIWAK